MTNSSPSNDNLPRPLTSAEQKIALRNLQHSDQTIAAFLAMLNKAEPGMFERVLQRASRRIDGIDWTTTPVTDPKAFAAVTEYVGLSALHARVSTELVRTNDPDAEDTELLAKRETLEKLVKDTEVYLEAVKAAYDGKLESVASLQKEFKHRLNSFTRDMVSIGVSAFVLGTSVSWLVVKIWG